jgi:GNAT superfamily N-acetyltransferase
LLADDIQRYLRSVLVRGREPIDVGGLVLYVHPTSSHPFLNYAIPAEGATSVDGEALIRAAGERGLVARLEYIEACFPWVEEELAPSGILLEARLRLMTCDRETLLEPLSDIELVRVEPGSPLVRDMLAVTHASFGEPPPSDDDVASWHGNAIAARIGDAIVGSSGWTDVIDGMSEIVGVGVAEAWRRRGIGGALTAAASRAAFADGASTALLTPGDDDTARVYERAGFADSTTMLHLRRQGQSEEPDRPED